MGKVASPEKLIIKSGTGKEVQIDNKQLRKTALVIRAVNHPLRQKLLNFIDERKRVHVSEIYKKLNLEQAVTSIHLAILRGSGIVTAERDGQRIHYTINKPRLAQVEEITAELSK